MFIQDLFKPENSKMISAYGVEIPPKNSEAYANLNDYSQPPENLEFVGFLLELDEEGEVMEELLDMILSYKLTNLAIAIEAPPNLITLKEHEDNKISLNSLLILASNIDCALSFLPPHHPSVDPSYTNDEYTELLVAVTKSLLNKPNHSQLTMPVSNYQEYLMLEQLLGDNHAKLKDFKPTDDYILTHFTPYSSEEEQNQFKYAIKETIISHYGGKKSFQEICRLIFQGVNQKSKDFLKGHVLNHIENEKKKNVENAEQSNNLENLPSDKE